MGRSFSFACASASLRLRMAILLCRSAFSDALFERGGLPDRFMRFCWVAGGGFTFNLLGGGGALRRGRAGI